MSPPHPLFLTAHNASGQIHLIVGSNPLASSRCTRSIELGATPIIVASADRPLHHHLQQRISQEGVEWIKRGFEDVDLTSRGRPEVDGVVDAVFVTLDRNDGQSEHISKLCRRQRIPINVVDAPELCSFTLLSTHSDGPLQIGITTSGNGCKLASRIRREVAATLPLGFGAAVERLGMMRRRIWEEDQRIHHGLEATIPAVETASPDDEEEAAGQKPSFNHLILADDVSATKTRRMRWLAQICEYWPLSRLAAISDDDIDLLLRSYSTTSAALPPSLDPTTSSFSAPPSAPRIILAGSGPGSPLLLTLATYRALATATLVLADKLVPAAVLALVPRRTPVHIARKFPGNADAAQHELLTLALDALRSGHTVLRLKQGDPFLYGRGGEECAWFRARGYQTLVLPGLTSALAAPLMAGVPCTQRGVADQVVVCTGTGRSGAKGSVPGFEAGRTLVLLMALHRLAGLVADLTGVAVQGQMADGGTEGDDAKGRDEAGNEKQNENEKEASLVLLERPWPADTPCAVIERASCPDQRVIRASLACVVAAVEAEGSRPPGLLVVGRACEVLEGRGGAKWVVEEGFRGLDGLGEVGGL